MSSTVLWYDCRRVIWLISSQRSRIRFGDGLVPMQAYCPPAKSASKIGSITITPAIWTTRSRIVGKPSGLSLPLALGIQTRFTGEGSYVLSRSSFAN